MAITPSVGAPGPGLSIAVQDGLMYYASATAGTAGDVVAVKVPTKPAADVLGLTVGGLYDEVGPPANTATDDVDANDTGILGVLLEDCVNGDVVRVRWSGWVRAKAGGTLAPGDMCSVELDTTGKLIPGVAGDKVVASYPGTQPAGGFGNAADGDLVWVYFSGITTFGEA